jgi:hypothetical protein
MTLVPCQHILKSTQYPFKGTKMLLFLGFSSQIFFNTHWIKTFASTFSTKRNLEMSLRNILGCTIKEEG